MPKIVKTAIVLVVLIVVSTLLTAFADYSVIELQGKVTRALEVVGKMERLLMFTTNKLQIQIAYTEYLKGLLEKEGAEALDYTAFSEKLIGKEWLEDEEYLYTQPLNLDTLLTQTFMMWQEVRE